MKVRVILPPVSLTAFVAVVGASLFIAPKLPAQAIPPPSKITTVAEVERVIVTGSNIPQRKRPGLIRSIRIVRQTSKNWAFVMQRTF